MQFSTQHQSLVGNSEFYLSIAMYCGSMVSLLQSVQCVGKTQPATLTLSQAQALTRSPL